VGGNFDGALQAAGPDVEANNVVLWDGAWRSLAGGVSGDVFDVAFWGGTLFVGGNFQTAGEVPSTYLAAWLAGPAPVATEPNPMQERPDAFLLSAVYPNPFNPEAQFSLTVATTQRVEVGIYDALGRRVRLLHAGLLPGGSRQTFRFEGTGLSSGVYFLRVAGETFHAGRAVVLMK
jgi:hypothetical protein